MKLRLLTTLFVITCLNTFTQTKGQNSEDFEHNILRNFGSRNGLLDTASSNPMVNSINPKPISFKYKRDEYSRFDNIKIYPKRNLIDVSPYSTYEGNPPQLSMKVFTSAPPGTMIEVQLGSKKDDNYPSGVHSQYQAFTTLQNAWEELTFSFAVIPSGSNVKPDEVDKITIIFSPNSNNSDVYYFDELIGPPMTPTFE